MTLIPSAARTAGPAYWALALKPATYRIFDAIAHLPIDWWVTKGSAIARGDRVVIWQYTDRDGQRGIVALGEVIDGPQVRSDADNPYHIAPVDPTPVERVAIRYIPLIDPMWVGGPNDQLLTSLSVSRAHGGTVFRVTPDQWNAVVSASERSSVEADIEQISTRVDLSPTEREALVQARRGQGRFRQDLVKYWQGCAVVGSTVQSILRASHIQPWRKSSDRERLDPANGLLLTANLDALFNDGLISFDDDGEMMISSLLRQSDRHLLQLGGKLRKRPIARQAEYLQYHRDYAFSG
jgi:EVE domain/HNH endonuclease